MMDYAVIPPEVNSGRMYAGAGSGPLMAAAMAWDRLAAEFSSAAASYRAVISELADGVWRGPASTSMTAAAEPYATWMSTTASRAMQAASQARAAAAAYEQAFAATVPPAVVAANRATLASLVATNFFGQNAPAIAANQVEYGEMWAQDAAAMYGYAGNSAAAVQLTPFPAAPQNTNSAGASNQAAAVTQATGNSAAGQGGGIFQNLLNFLNGNTPAGANILNFLENNPLITTFNQLASGTTGFQSIVGGLGYGSAGFLLSTMPGVNSAIVAASTFVSATAASTVSSVTPLSESALGTTLAGSYGPGLAGGATAGLGQAAPVGGLSVPQSWAAAAPEVRLATSAVPAATAGLAAAPPTMGMGGLGGMPIVGSMVNAPRNGEGARNGGARAKAAPGMPAAFEDGSNRWVQSGGDDSVETKSEREQLSELRKVVARLAKERDVLQRSAATLIRQATQP